MMTEDKLNFEIRKSLKTIIYENIRFNPAEASENIEVIERTMKGLIQAMKDADPLFEDISQRFVFCSSYHEKVSIKKAEEFDLYLLLRLPFQSEDVETCMPDESPAFVTYRLKRDPTSILDHDRKWTADLYQKFPEFFDDNLFLMRSKVQEWMQSVVDKTWNACKFPQMLKRQSETGCTFVISFKRRKLMIDIVPVIEGHQNVPPRGMHKSDRFMQLKQQNQAKGKNRQNIHRKAPPLNVAQGRHQALYTPRGHNNGYHAKVFSTDAFDTDDGPHRPPPTLQDYVPYEIGGADDQAVEYDPEDDASRGYGSFPFGGNGSTQRESNASARGSRGASARGRGHGGGWQVVGPKRLPVHAWCLVPKLSKQQTMVPSSDVNDAYWRLSYPEAEKRLLHGTGCLTTLIRIFKYLRNRQNWTGLSSYSIKTLFLEEFDSLNATSDYWMETRLGTLFLDLLDVLTQAVRNRRIPHYFNREANLLENLHDQTAETITLYLEAMSNEIREHPKLIFKYFRC